MMREVNENIVTNVAANLKKCREEKNLTQAELAEETGLKLSAYQEMEAGKRFVKLHVLISLSHALQVELGELTRM